MREVAARLGQLAVLVDAAGSAAGQVVPAGAFTGPGRAGHDAALHSVAQNATMAGSELMDEASKLGRDADRLEREQKAWDRRKAEEEARRRRQLQQDRDRAAAAAARDRR